MTTLAKAPTIYQAKGRSYLKQVEAIIKVASNVAEPDDIRIFETRMVERGRGTFSELCKTWINIYKDCFASEPWSKIGTERLSVALNRTHVKKRPLYPENKPLLPGDHPPGNDRAENWETYRVARQALLDTEKDIDTVVEQELARFREMCDLQKENEQEGDPFGGRGYGGSSGNLSELYRGSSATFSESGGQRGSSASLSEMGGVRLKGSASGGSLAGYGAVGSPLKGSPSGGSSFGGGAAGSPFGRSVSGRSISGRSMSGGSPMGGGAAGLSPRAGGSRGGSAKPSPAAGALERGRAGGAPGGGSASGSPEALASGRWLATLSLKEGASEGGPAGAGNLYSPRGGASGGSQAGSSSSQGSAGRTPRPGTPARSQAGSSSGRGSRRGTPRWESPVGSQAGSSSGGGSPRDSPRVEPPAEALANQEILSPFARASRASRVDQRQPTEAAATSARGESQGGEGRRGEGEGQGNARRRGKASKFCCSGAPRVRD